MTHLLTAPAHPAQDCPVAAQSATGIGLPNHKAHQRPSFDARRFFIACRVVAGDCLPVLRRAVRGGLRPHRSLCRQTNRVPSVTSIGLEVADSNLHKESAMSHDTLAAPSRFAVRIAHHFGDIADTLDWDHSRWLALSVRLDATGKAPEALSLGEVQQAIAATVQEAAR